MPDVMRSKNVMATVAAVAALAVLGLGSAPTDGSAGSTTTQHVMAATPYSPCGPGTCWGGPER
jgi:hypothetical protein